MTDELVLPAPCLIVLIGPSGAGKSTWAEAHFPPSQIVSSDALRATVGESEDDLAASDDAFAILEQIVEQRLTRGLTTIVDTLGLDAARRRRWVDRARRRGLSAVAVVFTTPAAECRVRNRARAKPIADRAVAGQVRQLAEQRALLTDEGFELVVEPAVARMAPRHLAKTTELAAVQQTTPTELQFGLQVPVFTWPGGPFEIRSRLASMARAAEEVGFSSVWVMDHFRQIPMFGPPWHDMLESYTVLAHLAAVTERVRLGTLVSGITHRNVAHLAKIVATLDVLSGGRAVCGLGLGWFEAEHHALGWRFPPVAERYELLEDALELLPLMWGPGAPAFAGRVLDVPEAMCYPRPLQQHLPILVGGNGERRTLRLAAQYADMCNIIGELDVVAHKVAVLHAHCAELGRPPDAVTVTQLSTTLVGRDGDELDGLIERLRPRRLGAQRYAARVNAGTVTDQIGRFRALADAGVTTAIVSLPDAGNGGAIERFAPVIEAFTPAI